MNEFGAGMNDIRSMEPALFFPAQSFPSQNKTVLFMSNVADIDSQKFGCLYIYA
jgi:hypothetical protein